jgi:hypothetical protein
MGRMVDQRRIWHRASLSFEIGREVGAVRAGDVIVALPHVIVMEGVQHGRHVRGASGFTFPPDVTPV